MPDKRFLTIDDLTHLPPPTWMVEGMFERNSLVMLAGPSGSYKSFLAIDWMMCMVTGRRWNNRPTAKANVLYALGEGKSNLLKRLQAWIHYNQPSQRERELIATNFAVTFDVPQLAQKSSVDNMLACLVAENFQPDVIVIDTFARSFVGLDENSQKDTGLWVEQADRLRNLGYTVIFLHHVTKNAEFGVRYRGSTAIMGAMDTAMNFVKDSGNENMVALKVTKQKDHDEGPELFFNRQIVNWSGNLKEASIILVPTVPIDQRFTDEFRQETDLVQQLLDDPSFETDMARAEELALRTGLDREAARNRLNYRKRKGIK